MSNILTIAGSDPSGQAGIQADLQVIRALGHRGFSAITAVTAQNDERVYSVNPVATKTLKDQLRALFSTYEFAAIKVGLLVTNELAYQIYRILNEVGVKNIVVDPIMRSSSGTVLLESAALSTLTGFLFPLARIVTPNLDEAESLTGMNVRDLDAMAEAAEQIRKASPGLETVLVKGGHLKDKIVDLLWDGTDTYELGTGDPLSNPARGTGCILSSAIACFLADGLELPAAVQKAKSFLEEFIPTRLA